MLGLITAALFLPQPLPGMPPPAFGRAADRAATSVPVTAVADGAIAPQPADPAAAPAAPTPPLAVMPAADGSDDIVVTAVRRDTPGDPLAAMNAASYDATQAVDRAVVAPVARAYASVLPRPARDGIRNALNNLHSPIIALNFLLQHKIGKALATVARFAINSTVGIGGLFDIARRRPFALPYRRNGFANTLGFTAWGRGLFCTCRSSARPPCVISPARTRQPHADRRRTRAHSRRRRSLHGGARSVSGPSAG